MKGKNNIIVFYVLLSAFLTFFIFATGLLYIFDSLTLLHLFYAFITSISAICILYHVIGLILLCHFDKKYNYYLFTFYHQEYDPDFEQQYENFLDSYSQLKGFFPISCPHYFELYEKFQKSNLTK